MNNCSSILRCMHRTLFSRLATWLCLLLLFLALNILVTKFFWSRTDVRLVKQVLMVDENDQPIMDFDKIEPRARTDKAFYEYFDPPIEICNTVTSYGAFMVEFKRLLINSSSIQGNIGGEDYRSVMFQSESSEYVQLGSNTFAVECPILHNIDNLVQFPRSHFPEFLAATRRAAFSEGISKRFGTTPSVKAVFLVKRFEYVNLHHCTTEWYNTYLGVRRLGLRPQDVHVLLIDAHPAASLDSVWLALFGGYSRIGQYRPTVFTQRPTMLPSIPDPEGDPKKLRGRLILADRAVWSPPGYHSPMTRLKTHRIHLIEEFRDHFLTSHGVEVWPVVPLAAGENPSHSRCRPRLVVILRRNYVSHPRQRTVGRKFANEQEILYHLQKATVSLPDGQTVPLVESVIGVQLDQLTMQEQLKFTGNADILLGVHGAGMTHAMYMPHQSAVVELFPMASKGKNFDFEAIARWKDHVYVPWRKSTPETELTDEALRIPPLVVIDLVTEAISKFQRKFSHCTSRSER
ncbi:hypothetical protein SprV_0100058700 [Sparganum proliferum]